MPRPARVGYRSMASRLPLSLRLRSPATAAASMPSCCNRATFRADFAQKCPCLPWVKKRGGAIWQFCCLIWTERRGARRDKGDSVMAGSTSLRLMLASGTALAALCALPGAAFAQTTGSDQTTPPATTPTGAATPNTGSNIAATPADQGDNGKDIVVTGSRLKQDPNNSALPLQIITNQELPREGISSPEQLISFLSTNGNSPDNLASNSDVVGGAQRGTNGLSSANLRGQGSAATLVLLNGRRVAAHGLQGSAVDVNQIPFAAIDRIEILKDGASAIYGTDAIGGVNVLDLPGGAGCDSGDGGMAYDDQLWANASARYACSWDTGRAVVLQQPTDTLTYYGRATVALGNSQIYAEVTGSNANSSKLFSNNQYSGNTSTLPLYYPRNALTASTYDAIYNQLVAVFPTIAANYGKPIAYRWRCIDCGQHENDTDTKTLRFAGGADGPLFEGWDYRVGGSYARSDATSTLGSGYA